MGSVPTPGTKRYPRRSGEVWDWGRSQRTYGWETSMGDKGGKKDKAKSKQQQLTKHKQQEQQKHDKAPKQKS